LLMLTAKSAEIDRILGLEIGADDYMTKPFSVRELQARVKALLRRAHTTKDLSQKDQAPRTIITYNCFTLDLDKRKILRNDKKLELTVKEFDLLSLFLQNPGRTYSRTDLLSLIWGYQYAGYEHTVNSHINRLRMKIEEDPGDPRFLKTVWGIGYRFAEETELAP
ncbi:MAG: response regulator transcription factor, partial [Spirochaetales bacterium]|nr:response regulator transcription factor [Spirochaetales bacterium]